MEKLMIVKKHINIWFNIFLLFVYLIDEVLYTVLSYKEEETTLYDIIFEQYPIATSILSAAIVFASVAIITFIIKSFWDRFIRDIFQVRSINYQESFSLVLIFALIT